VTVAVVDTGITVHQARRRVLPGYDFVSDPGMTNDGDGRDNDPSDRAIGPTITNAAAARCSAAAGTARLSAA
jgi:hypothetical protein